MKISANILTRDRLKGLKEAIKSVYDYVDEIVVMDTGSVDGTREYLSNLDDDKVKFVCKKWTDHFGEMRNALLDESSGDYILVIDDDMELVRFDFVTGFDYYKATVRMGNEISENFMFFKRGLRYRNVPRHATIINKGSEGLSNIEFVHEENETDFKKQFAEHRENITRYLTEKDYGVYDPTLNFNLMRSFYFIGHHINCIHYANETLRQTDINKSTRALACLFAYDSFKEIGRGEDALTYLVKAIQIEPVQVRGRVLFLREFVDRGGKLSTTDESFKIISEISKRKRSRLGADIFLNKLQIKNLKKELCH